MNVHVFQFENNAEVESCLSIFYFHSLVYLKCRFRRSIYIYQYINSHIHRAVVVVLNENDLNPRNEK